MHLLMLSPLHPSPTLMPPCTYPSASLPQLTWRELANDLKTDEMQHLFMNLEKITYSHHRSPRTPLVQDTI